MKKMLLGAILTMGFSSVANAALIYRIDEGSTITNTANDATAPLNGSFVWEQPERVVPDPTSVVFRTVALTFNTTDFSFFLDEDTVQPTSSVLFAENDPTRCLSGACETFFSAPVVLVSGANVLGGLEFSTGAGGSGGSYEGSLFAPTRLFYSDVVLLPSAGGAFLARADFSATLVTVPEPSSILVFLYAMVGLFCARRGVQRPFL